MKKPITFGKYLLLERINVGGMAEVFKAKTFGVEGFERLIAVKRILPSIAEDQEFITMFVDEAKIAVQLTHANVAQIFDLGRVGDSYFIAMEFIHGKDMRAIFDRARKRGETVPVPMACYTIMKVCEGLDYAHNKKDAAGRDLQLVHRDVSPQNVLLSYDGECKVIDFGIAKAAGKAGQTQAGILKGKFGYMSPEQVRGLPLDRRSDIFAAGICLYELLTGERLFVGESDFSTLEKVRNVEIMPPSTYNRRIPEELEHIVLKALAKDVEDRYQTAMDLHDDLQSFMYTSGNFFSRKDLSAYMRKAFAEEIAKESAREEEYRRMEQDLGRPSGSGLEQFDNISGSEALPSRPTAAPGRPTAEVPKPPPPPKKTVMGGMGVPPPPPRTSMPTPPPLVQAAPAPTPAPTPPPPARASGPALDMEWDEEELSTQIYDKPEGGSLLPDLPPMGGMDRPRVTAAPVQAPAPASPVVSQAAPVQGAPSPFTGPIVVRPAPAPSPAPPLMAAPIQGSPSPFSEVAREPTSVVRNSTATTPKSGLGVVLAVVGIAAALVIGLGAWFVMRSQPGTISVATVPTDSVVFVDGERASTSAASPFVVPNVAPGSHIVEVRRHGYSSWGAPIQVNPGQSLMLPPVTLVATAGTAVVPPPGGGTETPPPVVGTGFALDTLPTGAQVWVGDRQLTQRTPVRVTDLAPGTYQIRVELADYASWGTTITLQQGQIQQLQTPSLALRNVMVDFTSTPDGADVVLVRGTDRRPVGRTPVSAAVENGGGAWTVEMTRSGSVDYSAPLTLPANQPRASHNAELVARAGRDRPDRPNPPPDRPNPPPDRPNPPDRVLPTHVEPAGGPGTLRVNSRPWSQVRVDGRVIGNTPQMSISLPAGSHRVELSNPESNQHASFSVEIRPGQTETRIVTLE